MGPTSEHRARRRGDADRRYPPIEDHGLIGDLHTVALVAMDGTIDFACFPHFDSPSVFARLLDHEKGGFFRLAPACEEVAHRQMYLPASNVLMTRFLDRGSIAEVSDFMPIEMREESHQIVRRAKTVHGEVCFRMVCAPRFDYGRAGHQLEVRGREARFVSRGADGLAMRLRSNVDLRDHEGAAVAEVRLGADESAWFLLEQMNDGDEGRSDPDDYVVEAFKTTLDYWRSWMRRSRYRGPWREMVDRSALTLKILTSQPTGSLVAAPTFGLPENVGGERNWDYRFTWIRDSSFSIYALMRLGYTEEAGRFLDWIDDRCRELEPDGSLQTLYRLDGAHDATERTLDHLSGYRGSRPVRIGNRAHCQLQLDIYGELMDAVYLYDKYGEQISWDLWRNLARLVDRVCKNWEQPDEGIWENRGGRREFLYSRVMCWVAIDRALRLSRKRSLPGPVDDWVRVRDRIYRHVMAEFWNPERGALMQYKGADTLDAAALLLPLIRFVGPKDPRWLSTLAAIEKELMHDTFVYRYREGFDDGLDPHEGTFTACTFWLVECLSRAGDLQKARLYLEKTLGYANHLGLFAEELGPGGEHLGNFPQALTHLALISAAHDLSRRLGED